MTVRRIRPIRRRLFACAALLSAAAILTACANRQREAPAPAPAAAPEPMHDPAAERALTELARHDVLWDSPGNGEAGSMPIGNGTFGANVWLDAKGDLLLLLSHTDSFSEIERLLKLGRVRVSCDPPLASTPFAQRMRFADGMIEIDAGAGADRATVRLWIDSASEVLHATVAGARPRTVTATLENWRNATRTLEGGERNSSWVMRDAPASIALTESADIVVPVEQSPEAVAWYHRNESSIVPFTLEHQGLLARESEFSDPLILRTFGGRIEGEGFARVDAHSIRAEAPRTGHALRISVACSQADDLSSWQRRLAAVAANASDAAASRARTASWWRARFAQSWVFVDMPEAGRGSRELSQAYAAQRAATLAATAGAFPVKFNGSIFTVAPRFVNGAPFNADFRNWGGDYWWQNTRLPYHGMLARGDGDRLRSLFDFYFRAIRGCSVRAKEYYGAEGAYFPETMTTFATYGNGDYGWNRVGVDRGVVQCPYWQWAWNQGPELVALMLDHWDHTGDARMLEERTIPTARAVLRYFDTRFSRDARGTLVISPTQSIENLLDGRGQRPPHGRRPARDHRAALRAPHALRRGRRPRALGADARRMPAAAAFARRSAPLARGEIRRREVELREPRALRGMAVPPAGRHGRDRARQLRGARREDDARLDAGRHAGRASRPRGRGRRKRARQARQHAQELPLSDLLGPELRLGARPVPRLEPADHRAGNAAPVAPRRHDRAAARVAEVVERALPPPWRRRHADYRGNTRRRARLA